MEGRKKMRKACRQNERKEGRRREGREEGRMKEGKKGKKAGRQVLFDSLRVQCTGADKSWQWECE